QVLQLPDLPLCDEPGALQTLLAGPDYVLQQHLACTGPASPAACDRRAQPPRPSLPHALPQRLPAVDLQPEPEYGPRSRLLGPGYHSRGLAHVPQVLLLP